jgi:hypothetical protein
MASHIERMYWGVFPAVLEGVVDEVRTALINLVAGSHRSPVDRVGGLHAGSLHGMIPGVPPPASVTQVSAGTVHEHQPIRLEAGEISDQRVGSVMVLVA